MTEEAAMSKCALLKIAPIPHPMGEDGFHTGAPFNPGDLEIGYALAYFLGDLFHDKEEDWDFGNRTSVDQWARIARALRIHGLRIAEMERPRLAALEQYGIDMGPEDYSRFVKDKDC